VVAAEVVAVAGVAGVVARGHRWVTLAVAEGERPRRAQRPVQRLRDRLAPLR